jgi:O-antigen/teichoic acid export membrane protein
MSSASVVARNSVFGVLALAVDKGIFMVIVLALARYLSTADFGRWAFIMTCVAVLQIVADLGIEMILVSRASQNPNERDELMANGLALRLTSGFVCWGLAAALIPALAGASYLAPSVVGGSCLVTTAWTAYKILYRSLMRIEYLLVLISFNAAATALCVIVVIVTDGQLMAAVAAMAIASAVTLPFAVWLSRRLFGIRLRWNFGLWLAIVREALPLGVNAVLVTLALRIGPLFLLRLRGPEEVAYFSAASKLVEGLVLLPEVPMLTVFPTMVAFRSAARERFLALSQAVTKWVVILVLPIVLAIAGLSGPLIRLMYGEGFAASDGTLRVLVWATTFAASGAVWIGVLTTVGLQRVLMRMYALSTLVNVGLCLLLVPSLGSMGAATAAVVAAMTSQGLLLCLPSTAPHLRPAFAGVVVPVSVAILLSIAGAFPVASPLVATSATLALYALAIWLTGAIGADERRWAEEILKTLRRGA